MTEVSLELKSDYCNTNSLSPLANIGKLEVVFLEKDD